MENINNIINFLKPASDKNFFEKVSFIILAKDFFEEEIDIESTIFMLMASNISEKTEDTSKDSLKEKFGSNGKKLFNAIEEYSENSSLESRFVNYLNNNKVENPDDACLDNLNAYIYQDDEEDIIEDEKDSKDIKEELFNLHNMLMKISEKFDIDLHKCKKNKKDKKKKKSKKHKKYEDD